MEVFRKRGVFILINILIYNIDGKSTGSSESKIENTTHNCPFTRIIEDIFKISNKTSPANWKYENIDYPFNSSETLININKNISKTIQDELVSDIIASIKRIANLTNSDSELNEAIILNVPDKNSTKIDTDKKLNAIKSGLEDKIDVPHSTTPKNMNKYKIDTTDEYNNPSKPSNQPEIEISSISNENKPNYVEVLTVEPNNTNNVNKTSSILEVLKNIMPMLNSSVTKDLHSITIIERNQNKNHSFSETKNISTIIMKYCDKENFTKVDLIDREPAEDVKDIPLVENYDDYKVNDYFDDYEDSIQDKMTNISIESRKDIMEAAEYGMKKMHELYGVLEPKLYSMGLVLNERDPARYVAAFNAPFEDVARYAQYGYASLQAAAKLRQLIGIEQGASPEGRTEPAQLPSASALRQSALLQQCPLRGPPKCPPASKRYRTHDGTCNNLSRPRWGATMTPVQRFLPPVYSDDIQAPRRSIFGPKLPSAREISALVHEDKNAESTGVTHLLMQWGQFLDHDITSSSQSRSFNGSVPRCCKDGGRDFIPKEFMHPECMPIAVPPSDAFYGPRGVRCLDFVRSAPAPRDDCALGWREQFNQVSAYIDGSPLYASSARQSDRLRLFRNGMLQYGRVQQRRPLLPADRDELCRGGAASADCFRSGDARVNEQPGLVAAHIVWLRQHNRMAQELAHLNPHWSDEKIYQETRKIVGAMIQHISYREFLPIVLGTEVMRLFELDLQQKGYYRGYSPKTNANPASAFGSAAFRFGHSLVQPSLMRYDRFHRPIANNVSLHNELTNPSNIWSMGAVDRLLLGMVNQPIQKRDEFITVELTNHLFETPHFGFGMDLAAINIQRGRDHGVPAYTTWREPCGLTATTSFDDLFRVMPARTVRKLKVLYKHVDDIDLFTGGMAERPVIGGLVGPTFACIIAQQFANLRKGDRFWYENGGFESSFTPAQLQQIRRVSLAQVLCRTLDSIDSIQPFVFLSADDQDNDRIPCRNAHLNNFDLSPWVEVNSASSNDIKKSEELDTVKPGKPKSTTTKPKTTKKPQKGSKVPDQSNSNAALLNKPQKGNNKQNKTEMTETDSNKTVTDKPKPIPIVQAIDDKLDFKIKTRRYSDSDPDTRQYSNDYYDDVQSVQSVVINNSPHKRPNSRPYISVTENINKYTYLINYVPRPTQSWRRTTRRHSYDRDKNDRDVVKVTYQSYDDTYRRPNRPYYNRHDLDNDFESRINVPVTESSRSSARSNDDFTTTSHDKLSTEMFIMTHRPTPTSDKSTDKFDPTTENIYKLLTFGYVGTYKGGITNDDKITTDKTKLVSITDKSKLDSITDKSEIDTNSKDFKTTQYVKSDDAHASDLNHGKLSTFILYETATKPYNSQRRNDEDNLTSEFKDKYYYVHNVLRKYNSTELIQNIQKKNEPKKSNDSLGMNNNLEIQERSGSDQIESTGEVKAARGDKPRLTVRKPSSSAKTPSVAFQVIPSENNPSQWAVYEERADLLGAPQRMPPIKLDPYSLRELPRPMHTASSRRRPARRRT